MKKYKVISYDFKYFDYGDILENVHNNEQYTRIDCKLGSPCFLKSEVENSPEFFKLIDN